MMMTVHVNGIVYFVLGVQMMIRKVCAKCEVRTLLLVISPTEKQAFEGKPDGDGEDEMPDK